MRKTHKIKVTQPIVLLLCCILFFSSVSSAFALGLQKRSDVWENLNDDLGASKRDTYPYSRLYDETVTMEDPEDETKSIIVTEPLTEDKIKSVGYDILYGTTHGLVLYYGEVPKEETFNEDKRVEGWDGYGYREDTTLSDTDYWGDTGISDDEVSIEDLENVNTGDNIVSLRLYALSISWNAIGFWFGNILYIIQTFFAGLGTKIINLLVIAKNIDMNTILEALGLKQLSEVINKSFIFNPEANGGLGSLSVFAVICLLILIVSLVSYAITYARGTKKAIDIKEILVPAAVGLLIIGMCLTGRINSLGGALSNVVTKIVYAVAGIATEAGGDGGGQLFITQVDDPANENKVVQIQEMSLINKCFIDMQICTQFDVSEISKLNVDNFGTVGTTAANDLPYDDGSGLSFSDEFANNLGYYYWFADTNAKYKTQKNATYPETSPVANEERMSAMITWMQKVYNSGDADTKEQIRTMVYSFARPHTMVGALRMFLFFMIMVALALCLWRYTKDILFAKLKMLLALLGMAIAGPLMITGKKQLVQTGKDLLGIILISFIEITIHSVMFDAIIFAVCIVMSPDLLRLVITFFLVLLLWKFNKKLNEQIHKMTERIERSVISSNGVVAQARRSAGTWLRDKPHKFLEDRAKKYDESVGADGKKHGGNLRSRMMHLAANTTASWNQTQSLHKLNSDAKALKKKNLKDFLGEQAKSAAEEVKEVQTDIDSVTSILSGTLSEKVSDKAVDAAVKDSDNWTAEERDFYEKSKTEEKDLVMETSKFDKLTQDIDKLDTEHIEERETWVEMYKERLEEQGIPAEDREEIIATDKKLSEIQKEADHARAIENDAEKDALYSSYTCKQGEERHGALVTDELGGMFRLRRNADGKFTKEYLGMSDALDKRNELAEQQKESEAKIKELSSQKAANEKALRESVTNRLKSKAVDDLDNTTFLKHSELENEELTNEQRKDIANRRKEELKNELLSGTDSKEASIVAAQNMYKGEMISALDEQTRVAKEQSKIKKEAKKIGGAKELDREAISTINANALRREELEAGVSMSSMESAKIQTKVLTDDTIKRGEYSIQNNETRQNLQRKGEDVANVISDFREEATNEARKHGFVAKRTTKEGTRNLDIATKPALTVAGAAVTGAGVVAAGAQEAAKAVKNFASDESVLESNEHRAEALAKGIVAARKKSGNNQPASIEASKAIYKETTERLANEAKEKREEAKAAKQAEKEHKRTEKTTSRSTSQPTPQSASSPAPTPQPVPQPVSQPAPQTQSRPQPAPQPAPQQTVAPAPQATPQASGTFRVPNTAGKSNVVVAPIPVVEQPKVAPAPQSAKQPATPAAPQAPVNQPPVQQTPVQQTPVKSTPVQQPQSKPTSVPASSPAPAPTKVPEAVRPIEPSAPAPASAKPQSTPTPAPAPVQAKPAPAPAAKAPEPTQNTYKQAINNATAPVQKPSQPAPVQSAPAQTVTSVQKAPAQQSSTFHPANNAGVGNVASAPAPKTAPQVSQPTPVAQPAPATKPQATQSTPQVMATPKAAPDQQVAMSNGHTYISDDTEWTQKHQPEVTKVAPQPAQQQIVKPKVDNIIKPKVKPQPAQPSVPQPASQPVVKPAPSVAPTPVPTTKPTPTQVSNIIKVKPKVDNIIKPKVKPNNISINKPAEKPVEQPTPKEVKQQFIKDEQMKVVRKSNEKIGFDAAPKSKSDAMAQEIALDKKKLDERAGLNSSSTTKEQIARDGLSVFDKYKKKDE